MPFLVVLVGLPGSGKTHMVSSSNISSNPATFIYSTDAYIEQVASTLQQTYTAVFEHYISEATSYMNDALVEAIAAGKTVVFDQTNLNTEKRAWILKQFPDNYVKYCLAISPPRSAAEQALLESRILSRPGKRIPDYVITSMLSRYIEPSISEGFDYVSLYSVYGELLKNERK